MRADQSILTDFLNHGILPFVGREEMIERIVAFRRGAIDAFGLRTFLILGEAGIGKSRLIEEVIPRIEEEGGVVAHFRLRPASTGSPISLLADVLWNLPTVRRLLRAKPGGGLDSVVDALRRTCRLRPTTIVVEDIHLLEGETLRDFATLLDVLTDDPVSLICTARPIDEGKLGLLEASLAERVELSGLGRDDIASLGDALFGPDGADEAINTLAEITLGNPLAIRGALRGALRQETIRREATGGWRGDERFGDVVRLGARSITEGLAVHLTPGERRAADALASLGEIFSYEAAEILLGDEGEKIIEALLFKGILVRSSTVAAPLPTNERSRYRILAFTHTLVHHTLLEEGKIPAMKLLEVFERKAPLYSIVPFDRLARVAGDVPREDRFRLIEIVMNSLAIASLLDETSEWTLARHLLDAVERIASSHILLPEERIRLELEFLEARLRLLQRDLKGEEFNTALERLFALAHSLPEEEAPQHTINALSHQYMRAVYAEHGSPLCDRLEAEIDALVMTAPSVIRTPGYFRCLGWKTERASLRGDWTVQEEVERRLEELSLNPDLSENLRAELKIALNTNYLLLVRTPEEYAKRLRRIEEADEKRKGSLTEVSWLLQKARFYGFTGHFKRQVEDYNRAIILAEKRGQKDVTASLAESLVKCRVALGRTLDEAEEILLRMGALTSVGERAIGDAILVNNLTAIALMRGEGEWAVRFYDRYFNPEETNPTTLPVLLALYRECPAQELTRYRDHPWIAGTADGIVRLLQGEGNEADEKRLEAFLMENLGIVPIATRHILSMQTALRLHILLFGSVPRLHAIVGSARAGLLRGLAWAEERELWPMIAAYLQEFGYLLEKEEGAFWAERTAILREANRSFLVPSRTGDGKGHLSVFGAIRYTTSSDDPGVSPRGQRLKTLLGVMVANEILARPLERDEFLLIASGRADDPKHARDIVNKTVSRLRESLGSADVILTDGDTPRLNRDVMEVDLIDAMESIARARDAVRHGALMRGTREMKKVFERWNGEVPYPALYDEFFERLREEFELAVRDTSLLLAEGLLEEGDGPGAEDLLRRLYAIIPEDAEVGELLIRTLEADGRKVEAMRIRQQNEPVA